MDVGWKPPGLVLDLVRANAGLDNTAPALLSGGRIPLNYTDLLYQIDCTVRVLIAAGVEPNDRVAVVASSDAEMVALFLSIASIAGCAPLNPSYTATELTFYLEDLRPRLLIVEEGLPTPARDVARQLGIPVLEVVAGGQAAGKLCFVGDPRAAARAVYSSPDDAALVLHTSGTTGRPKMVLLTQRNLCNSALNIAQSLALSPNDRCLSVMPMFHIHGLVGAALSTIASGGSLACAGIFRAPAFGSWLEVFEPTWYTASPSIHAAVLARGAQLSGNPSSRKLRFIRSCSAPLSPHIIAGLEDLFAVPVVEAYGMTEAAHQMASNPLPPEVRKPGSVGVPTDTEIAIMDAAGAVLPQGTEGEIVVRGASVMGGYVADAAVNAAAFTKGWFRTGDQGRFDEQGYLFITGRIKEIINRGGEKISPREIDEVLLAHPAVAEAVAFALPDARLGEDVGAAIVLKPEVGELDTRALLNFAETRLASFKLPRRILFVREIPKGPTGKPQRVGLARRLGLDEEDASPGASVPMEPTTPTELTLLRLCLEAFQVEMIGIHDDFFDSGADSISAMTLLLEIERQWDVTVTIADMLSASTIARLAQVIDHAAPTRQAPQLAVIQSGGARQPFFCIGAGPRYFHLARLLGSDQPFFGTVHPHPSKLPRVCRIEDVAAHHLQIIREAQPSGPYFLGGWCIDGLVAYEVAQRLRALGKTVGLLVLFDTSVYPSRFAAVQGWARIGMESVVLRSRAIRQTSSRETSRKMQERLHRLGTKTLARFGVGQGSEIPRPGGWLETAVQRRAAYNYRPRPYDGRVLVLQRSLNQSPGTRAAMDWSRFIKGLLERCDVPGDHLDFFEKPHVSVTADRLDASLRAAQAAAKADNGRSSKWDYTSSPYAAWATGTREFGGT